MRLTLGIIFVLSLFLVSCASKKEVLYMQDADLYNNSKIGYEKITIQPNDILKITVGALIAETANPYNRLSSNSLGQSSLDILRLDGYLVSNEYTIVFPVLGKISVANKTTAELEFYLEKLLTEGGHLTNPEVVVRILNAKVTVLGEVNNPGTYAFTEESITLLQALGYAGDLTIRGKREDILILREIDGVRKISHIDLTSGEWLEGEYNFIKPNDVIVVNPNNPMVSSAGYIGDVGTIIGLTSFALSLILLITR